MPSGGSGQRKQFEKKKKNRWPEVGVRQVSEQIVENRSIGSMVHGVASGQRPTGSKAATAGNISFISDITTHALFPAFRLSWFCLRKRSRLNCWISAFPSFCLSAARWCVSDSIQWVHQLFLAAAAGHVRSVTCHRSVSKSLVPRRALSALFVPVHHVDWIGTGR